MAAPYARAAPSLQTFEIESSGRSGRCYRGLILANGLRVLLASDPSAEKAAAAMNVRVGTLSDPRSLPGLAHFCEHMLFLGTETFPDEDEFDRYISSNGGESNAYTELEDTRYFFSVAAFALPGALERFSGFFSMALFTESATAGEVSAIDSEHTNNLQDDDWRFYQLLKLRMMPSHPFSAFDTGNRQTLRGGDAIARAALLQFYAEHYIASEMSLAIVAPLPLRELQRLAIANFGRLPARSAPRASAAYESLPLPFTGGQGTTLTLMRPIVEERTLSVVWCVPKVDSSLWDLAKPDVIWSQLLQSPRGLASALRSAGLILDLDASSAFGDFASGDAETGAFATLSAEFRLTEAGLRRWPEVTSALFSYLRLLRDGGVPGHVFSEARLMRELSLRYAEPLQPYDFAPVAAAAMPHFEPSRWVSGPVLLFDGAEAEVDRVLQRTAEPRDAILTLTADELPGSTPNVEPIYGTQYGSLRVQPEVWARSSSLVLTPPLPNRFLPSDLRIRPPPAAASAARHAAHPAPRLLQLAPSTRLYHLQDTVFRLPYAYAFLQVRGA